MEKCLQVVHLAICQKWCVVVKLEIGLIKRLSLHQRIQTETLVIFFCLKIFLNICNTGILILVQCSAQHVVTELRIESF